MHSRFFSSLLVFFGFYILVSIWLGTFFFEPLIIFPVSVILSFFLLKKFPVPAEKIPFPSMGIISLILLITIIPFLFIHPFFDSSADGMHTIIPRLLASSDSTPDTFEPYSELPFTYSHGFHYLPATVVKFLGDSYAEPAKWFFGMLFVLSLCVMFFLVSKEILGGNFAALLSLVFLLGSKIVFQNAFYGLYPYISSLAFMLFGAYLLLKKNKLFYFTLPIIAVLSPGGFIVALLFFAVLILAFRENILKKELLLIIFAIPVFLRDYLVLLSNFLLSVFSESGVSSFSFDAFLPGLLWAGWVPLAVFLISLGIFAVTKRSRLQKIFLSAFILGFALFIVIGNFSPAFAGKLVEFYSLLLILFSAQTLFPVIERIMNQNKNYFIFFLALISVVTIFSSSTLLHQIGGSKISSDDARLAENLFSLDPVPKKAFYFGVDSQKFAEYSNKMPYDILSAGFLFPSAKIQVKPGYYAPITDKHIFKLRILQENCLECIQNLPVDYVITPKSVPVIPGFRKLLSNSSLTVFARNE